MTKLILTTFAVLAVVAVFAVLPGLGKMAFILVAVVAGFFAFQKWGRK